MQDETTAEAEPQSRTGGCTQSARVESGNESAKITALEAEVAELTEQIRQLTQEAE